MNDNTKSNYASLLRILPFPYDSFEEVNEEDRFSVIIGSTEYEIRNHFDPSGRQTVFDQLKKLLLPD
ncbi:MAG: hypothetical protein IKX16_01695 [Clostridia bacterium]|nr:hypothetical protein [Clostridia bacterium]